MKIFEKCVKWLAQLALIVSILCIAITVVMVTFDVLRRFIFKNAIVGATEYTQLLFIMMVLSIGATTMRGEHTAVDMFTRKMPQKLRVVLYMISDLLSLAVCVFIGVAAFKMVAFSKLSRASYAMVGIPEWPLLIIFGVAFSIGAITFILLMKRDLHNEFPDRIPMPEVISNTSLEKPAELSAEELGENYIKDETREGRDDQ